MEANSDSQFQYFGISPFLSSENALARFTWGVSETEKNPSEIWGLLESRTSKVVIPSHLWWREDSLEILKTCELKANQIQLQIGPGFELKTHFQKVQSALHLGYGLQVLVQTELNSEQKERLKVLSQSFGPQIEILFLWQETPNPDRVLASFQELTELDISLGATKKEWSSYYWASKQPALQKASVIDFEKQKKGRLLDFLEQTDLAKRTRQFRVTGFRFPIKEILRTIAHFFLWLLTPEKNHLSLMKSSLRRTGQSFLTLIRQFGQGLYWAFYGDFSQIQGWWRAFRVRVYWRTIDMMKRSYWCTYSLISDSRGQVWAFLVRAFWQTKKLSSQIYWQTRKVGSLPYWGCYSLFLQLSGKIKAITVSMFWFSRRMMTVLYWKIWHWTCEGIGRSRALFVVSYWKLHSWGHQSFWFLRGFWIRSRGALWMGCHRTYWWTWTISHRSYWGFRKFLIWMKLYPCWPIRKIYWFTKYQIEKRVLKKCS